VTDPLLRVLAVGIGADSPSVSIEHVADWDEARARLDADVAFDAVLVDGDALPASPTEVAAVAALAALLVVVAVPDAVSADDWLGQGADDIVGRDELASGVVWRRVRHAVSRRSGAPWRGAAYSTDPDTGLPHRQQLVEHLSQLLALREREPSPMAVLALRIVAVAGGGTASVAAPDGTHPPDRSLLRRKVAVRLRAGVRASDIVAVLGDDAFAVLLGSILAPGDADRVAAKLVTALVAPFPLAGGERSLSVAFGIAQYPHDGRAAEPLLRRALALAEAAPAVVSTGPAAARDGAGAPRTAANDDA
jgi:GGDEF domain-containing protein